MDNSDHQPDLAQLKERANFLAQELTRHNRLYFQDQAPIISDYEFDLLQREYDDLVKAHPDLRPPKSPDQTVGAPPEGSGLPEVTHDAPMLSLEKALNEDDLLKFKQRLERKIGRDGYSFFTMPKFDGLAVELYYEDRRLTLAATRGDGLKGEDVTKNVQTIQNIPATLPASAPTGLVNVRGEVFMEKEEFARLNAEQEEEGLDPFANPRNAAAGSLKRLNPTKTAKRNLNFVAYGLLKPEAYSLTTYADLIAALSSWSLPIEKSAFTGPQKTLEAVIKVFNALRESREDLAFEVDGLVITLNEIARWATLGQNARAPLYAVAAKFPPYSAPTKLKSISVQVGRLGTLTPVANLEPVLLKGALISQASLHNEEFIKEKDIREGDLVLLERAGDVIPYISKVLIEKRDPGLKPYEFPTTCPFCGHEAVRLIGETARRCVNHQCPARVKARLIHLASKYALDIEGLGPEIADRLLNANLLPVVTNIFRLKKTDLLKLPNFGEDSANNLLEAINRAKSAELWRFITGLSIPTVGEVNARALAKAFKTLEGLRNAVASAKEPFLKARDPKARAKVANSLYVTPKTLQSLIDFFDLPDNQELLQDLTDPTLVSPLSPSGFLPLSGVSFVITGTLSESRTKVEERLEGFGAEINSSVTKKTSFVVAGEKPGSKLDKAKKQNIRILNEGELARLLDENFLQSLEGLDREGKLALLNGRLA
ncbi:MAG: NAD-dependent DNA ligase LigA [Deltaproteobacteria bacterium]|jgi:DNA ligase (NAD+)|nr:NAD-dependent DNA ligase LigA [Deltaproteobacteria bacterium]